MSVYVWYTGIRRSPLSVFPSSSMLQAVAPSHRSHLHSFTTHLSAHISRLPPIGVTALLTLCPHRPLGNFPNPHLVLIQSLDTEILTLKPQSDSNPNLKIPTYQILIPNMKKIDKTTSPPRHPRALPPQPMNHAAGNLGTALPTRQNPIS